MNCIVAVSENWAIGKNNRLLFSLPGDMKFFRLTTTGKTLIMGRKTLESFPGSAPLPHRTNLVLSRNPDFAREGAIICHSPEEVLERVRDLPPEEVMLIGGAEIYSRFLPYCSKAYVTRVEQTVPQADAFFPNLDQYPVWKVESVSEPITEEGITYRFYTYVRD